MQRFVCCRAPPLWFSGWRAVPHSAPTALCCAARGFGSRRGEKQQGRGGLAKRRSQRLQSPRASPPSASSHSYPTTRPGLESEGTFDALLALSLALYEDEAVHTTEAAAPLQIAGDEVASVAQGDGTIARKAEFTKDASASSSPLKYGESLSSAGSASTAAPPPPPPPEDAYSSLCADDLMEAMSSMTDCASSEAETNTASTRGVENASMSTVPLQGNHRHSNNALRVDAFNKVPREQNRQDAGAASGNDFSAKSLTTSSIRKSPTLSSAEKGRQLATSATLAALLTSEETPLERKVLSLIDAISHERPQHPTRARAGVGQKHHQHASLHNLNPVTSNGGGMGRPADALADASSPLIEASSLLLTGLDMKAVLKHGELARRHLRHLSLTRCDFSHVRWSHVTVEDCDLSRSIFYHATWQHVRFRRCNFTGALMKKVHCNGPVTFEDCEFRLAAVGLEYTAEEKRDDVAEMDAYGGNGTSERDQRLPRPPHQRGLRFIRCNFDLSDFQFSSGLNRPSAFTQCSNTHLASKFPLRARGGVN